MGSDHGDDSPVTPEQAFGRVLRAARTKRRLSQERLALECGYTREYVSMIERGLRNPTLVAIFRLATVLEVSPTELIHRTEAMRPMLAERPTE